MQELWIEYLRLQCTSESSLATPTQQQEGGASTTTASAAKQKEKGQMFLRAMVSTNSYSVGLEVCSSNIGNVGNIINVGKIGNKQYSTYKSQHFNEFSLPPSLPLSLSASSWLKDMT